MSFNSFSIKDTIPNILVVSNTDFRAWQIQFYKYAQKDCHKVHSHRCKQRAYNTQLLTSHFYRLYKNTQFIRIINKLGTGRSSRNYYFFYGLVYFKIYIGAYTNYGAHPSPASQVLKAHSPTQSQVTKFTTQFRH